jgi:hypothetical protein
MDNWIAAQVNLTDGRSIRFGPDEADAENIPSAISFETTNPGGFSSGSITLPRPENLYADDAKLFSDVRLYGPGDVTYYEGLITGVPQIGTTEIQLELSGWSSVLERYQTFREIFVDRDLSRWSEMGTTLRLFFTNNGYTYQGGPAVEASDTGPTLLLAASLGQVNPVNHAWYTATPGCRVGSIYYEMTSISSSVYTGAIGVSNDLAMTATSSTGDLLTGSNSSATGTFTASHPNPDSASHAYLEFLAGGGENPSSDKRFAIKNLAVYGNHGLTKRGTAPEGFYASDVIAYIVGKASVLNVGEIESTSFVIPHLTFTEDTDLRTAIERVTAFGGNQNVAHDWGVYDNREFYWQSPGTYGRTWRVRREVNTTSSSDGPDADRRIAGIKVLYEDAAGTQKSVGPVGSNSDYETNDLLDADPDNPAHRIPGAFAVESIGIAPIETGYTYSRLAVNAGIMLLNERNRLDWRGSIEISGEVEDTSGNVFPVSQVRAGDRIEIADDERTHTVTATSYDHSSMTTRCDVGARPDSFGALLEQLAAVTDLIP